jgi:phage baseplate assembly protein W
MAQRYYLAHPFRFGSPGGIAVTTDADQHLRDRVLAVLFTVPGERVNHPSFGVGLGHAVFEPLDELTLGTLEYRVLEGLRRDVGDDIIIEGVDVTSEADAGQLLVNISFRRRSDRQLSRLEVAL